MKRIILLFVLATTLSTTYAQSLRLGVEGAFNSTWLFNKTVSDAGDELDYKSTFGGQFGAIVLYNFKEGVGISSGVLFGSVNQKYTNRIPLGGNKFGDAFETENKIKYIDIPVLFRITSTGGPYFEIGPQFSLLSKAEYTDKKGPNLPSTTADVKDNTNSLNISGQIGFGFDIKASEKVLINAGLRFGYGLTDARKKPSNSSSKYEATHTAVGGFHLGITYAIK